MSFIGNKWDDILKEEYEKEYFKNLMSFLGKEYDFSTVYPAKENTFAAFKWVDFDDVRVVILGQDPYHGGQANGMAFAVNDGRDLPPSLINIFKELESDLGKKVQRSGNLLGWASQGVLLLNTILTVRKAEPFSHSGIGWQRFTDAAIAALNEAKNPIVFLLWGGSAISKRYLISPKHHIISSPHPSPLSAHRGFLGSKPFTKANDFLTKSGLIPIDWTAIHGTQPINYYQNAQKIHRI